MSILIALLPATKKPATKYCCLDICLSCSIVTKPGGGCSTFVLAAFWNALNKEILSFEASGLRSVAS